MEQPEEKRTKPKPEEQEGTPQGQLCPTFAVTHFPLNSFALMALITLPYLSDI
jgi:hypothetical protein